MLTLRFPEYVHHCERGYCLVCGDVAEALIDRGQAVDLHPIAATGPWEPVADTHRPGSFTAARPVVGGYQFHTDASGNIRRYSQSGAYAAAESLNLVESGAEYGPWEVRNNGGGARRHFLVRLVARTRGYERRVGTSGTLIRYSTAESAQRQADALNALEAS